MVQAVGSQVDKGGSITHTVISGKLDKRGVHTARAIQHSRNEKHTDERQSHTESLINGK